ncbi:hypothetical protein DRW03_01355 [Corallococcus sp. H22C18031201]|nr:hypothetical protein DRW03_01355 [Corallococcus sp. H22C18031201]
MDTRTPSTRAPAKGGLFCELYWGTTLSEAWSYGPEQVNVHAAPDEKAPLPLYGFTLPHEPFLLAEKTDQGWRIHVPPAARVEYSQSGTPFAPLTQASKPDAFELREGMSLRLSEGELRLIVAPSVVKDAPRRVETQDVVRLILAVLFFLSAPLAFLTMAPDPARLAASNARVLQQARAQEAERLKAQGLDKPARPMTEQERADAQDAGTRIRVPASFGVR